MHCVATDDILKYDKMQDTKPHMSHTGENFVDTISQSNDCSPHPHPTKFEMPQPLSHKLVKTMSHLVHPISQSDDIFAQQAQRLFGGKVVQPWEKIQDWLQGVVPRVYSFPSEGVPYKEREGFLCAQPCWECRECPYLVVNLESSCVFQDYTKSKMSPQGGLTVKLGIAQNSSTRRQNRIRVEHGISFVTFYQFHFLGQF